MRKLIFIVKRLFAFAFRSALHARLKTACTFKGRKERGESRVSRVLEFQNSINSVYLTFLDLELVYDLK